MLCPFCKTGSTAPGTTTAALARGKTIAVIENVPAEICATCGEPYFDDATVARLVELASAARRRGVRREVRDYRAAS